MTRRLISILFLALASSFVIMMLGGLTGCNGTLGALKEANDYSPLFGYVLVTQEQEGEVWTGRLRHSRGKEVMLFKFTPSGGEARQEYLLFPRRFFAWAGKHVAYCGAEQQEVILVDYQTQKEVFSAGGSQSALLTSAPTLGGRNFSLQPKRRFTWYSRRRGIASLFPPKKHLHLPCAVSKMGSFTGPPFPRMDGR